MYDATDSQAMYWAPQDWGSQSQLQVGSWSNVQGGYVGGWESAPSNMQPQAPGANPPAAVFEPGSFKPAPKVGAELLTELRLAELKQLIESDNKDHTEQK